MTETDPTCGEELAASAEVPEAVAALFAHVVLNLEAHAAWVGVGTDAARTESEAMRKVARAYGELSNVAQGTALLMRSLRDLPPAVHDHAAFERRPFIEWMEVKVGLQRRLGQLLLDHAASNELALERMRAAAHVG